MSATEGTIATPVDSPLSLRELSAVLVKHYGLHEGQYDLLVEFKIGVGGVAMNAESASPGAMIGIGRVGLVHSLRPGPATVDAAEVNPRKPGSRAKRKG